MGSTPLFFIPLLLLLVLFQHTSGKGHGLYRDKEWCYGNSYDCGEPSWQGKCKNGKNQSPIDLPEDIASLKFKKGFKNLNKSHINMHQYRLENNEHTLEIFPLDVQDYPKLFVPHLKANYYFKSLHFHWGSEKGKGSEHTVDGVQYEGEVHLLYHKDTYKNLHDALESEEDDAVLAMGFFLQEDKNSKIFENLVQHIPTEPRIVDVNAKLDLSKLWQGTRAYIYHGSSSVPPCLENIEFMLFKKPVPVAYRFMRTLRKMMNDEEDYISNNYKQTVPSDIDRLHAVRVHYRGDDEDKSEDAGEPEGEPEPEQKKEKEKEKEKEKPKKKSGKGKGPRPIIRVGGKNNNK